MSREFIFGDKRIIEALNGFVPVALNTFESQHRTKKDAARELFFKIVDQADLYEDVPKEYLPSGDDPPYPPPYHVQKSPKGTTQGFYACNPDGTLLFARWGLFANYGPDYLLRHLRGALGKHARTPIDKTETVHEEPISPKDIVVMNVYARAKPLPSDSFRLPEARDRSGRDMLWITGKEVEQLLAGRITEELGARITAFHLVDTTLGVPTVWWSCVGEAAYKAEPAKSPEGVRVRISGKFSLSDGDAKHRYEGTLKGELVFDSGKKTVTSFRMIADGTARGPTLEDYPKWRRPEGYSLKIGFALATAEEDRRIPPVAMTIPESREAYLTYRLK